MVEARVRWLVYEKDGRNTINMYGSGTRDMGDAQVRVRLERHE